MLVCLYDAVQVRWNDEIFQFFFHLCNYKSHQAAELRLIVNKISVDCSLYKYLGQSVGYKTRIRRAVSYSTDPSSLAFFFAT